ncbi:MAG: glycosyltransferase [Promethearchaeota archaeon]
MNDDSISILEKYENLLGKPAMEKLKNKAKKFTEKSILNVNSTKFGGGVAEILHNMIPLMNDLGINAEWETFTAPDSFFEISKKMHNALQGNMDIIFSEDEIKDYINQAQSTYDQLHPDRDFNIIHDPQPCPAIKFATDKKGKWIWRCHIDTSDPNPQAWNMIHRYLSLYDALIFTKLQYARKVKHKNIFQIPPSIDPFSLKNQEIQEEDAREIVERFIPSDLPLISQISRFDPWKDPLGVIDAYRIVKEKYPVRLALIGSLAHDDPEGEKWLNKINNYIGGDPYIHVLSNLDGVNALEVNAFQRVSKVIIQKSIKEGFGLTVTEALWKKTPVIGGNVGGIKLQIDNGVNGFLVDTVSETAEKILYLLKNPKIAKKMGQEGHKMIKNEFLLNKHVERYLDLFQKIS